MDINVNEFKKQFKFDDNQTSNAMRAKLVLFFVTKISRLRPDMTPAVICDRLDDWGYPGITPSEVIEAFTKDPDIRKSDRRDGAYEISLTAENRFINEIRIYETRLLQKTSVISIFGILLGVVVILLTLVVYNTATYHPMVRDLSWPEFRRRTGFDQPSTQSIERAKYFLYFITEVVELRDDMTPEVIEERLRDIGYTEITAHEIEKGFSLDPEIQASIKRADAFEISPLVFEKFETQLDIQFPGKELITLDWITKHIPATAIWGMIVSSVAIISACFEAGYWLGKRNSNSPK